MEGYDWFVQIADIAVSLALLVAVVMGFWKGEIISRKVLEDVISRTVHEVMRELRSRE